MMKRRNFMIGLCGTAAAGVPGTALGCRPPDRREGLQKRALFSTYVTNVDDVLGRKAIPVDPVAPVRLSRIPDRSYDPNSVAVETIEGVRLGYLPTNIGRILAPMLEAGLTFFDYTQEDDRKQDAALYARQIRGELDNYVLRKRASRPDGATVFLDIHSSCVRDASGSFLYGVRVIQDVTKANQMEDRIRESEQRMRDLLEALPAAIYTTDAAGRITFYNKAAVEMSGRTPQPGDLWCVTWRLYNADGSPLPHDQCPMAVALKENRPVRGAEAIAERPDGTRVPFIPYPTPLRDSRGNLVGAVNMLVDITERKQAESRQKVLIDELNHRVKNTLATVQSLAGQTARHSESPADFFHRFEARLLALSRAHDLLTRRHWEHAPLDSLAREVLMALAGDATGRIVIDGPSVDLNPRAALSFTMALNELATNAIKYGSLSSELGTLSVVWRLHTEVDKAMLSLDWCENAGPPVRSPSRRGFGTRLIERCIERDLGGELDLAFDPAGVSCRISIPVGLASA